MAFKRVKRTEAEISHAHNRMQDRDLFLAKNGSPKKLHRLVADVDFRDRRPVDGILGDLAYRATIERDGEGRSVTVLFPRRRGKSLDDSPILEDTQVSTRECAIGVISIRRFRAA